MKELYTIVGKFDDFEAGIFRVKTIPGYCAITGDYVKHLEININDQFDIEMNKNIIIKEVLDLAYNQWASPETRDYDSIKFKWHLYCEH